MNIENKFSLIKKWALQTHSNLNNRDDVIIGDYTYGEPYIRSGYEKAKCYIGKYCCIASGVEIQLVSNHHPEWISTYDLSYLIENIDMNKEKKTIDVIGSYRENQFIYRGDVCIGNNVWICAGVKIMPGCQIGDGAILSAGCVVTRDVAPYTVYGGVPAKLIKKRFPDDEIEILKKICWWDWDIEMIYNSIELIESRNVYGLEKFYFDNII